MSAGAEPSYFCLMGIRTPDGKLGILSVIATYLLGLVGLAGVVALVVSLALDSDFWSDDASDTVFGAVSFALVLLGAVGFVVMERAPWVGAALGVIGGLALSVILVWALVPIVLGVGAAIVAVLRARALTEHHAVPRNRTAT